MTVKRIAVVGTGVMGKGMAHAFALYGFKVDMFGRRDDVGPEFRGYLENEVKKGRMTPEQGVNILGNLCTHNMNTQPEKLSESDLIIETVKEDINVKAEIFGILGEYANQNAILASNTSSYSITRLAEYTPRPERFIGIHFFSPVPLMKLVEVVIGEKTDEKVISPVIEVVKKIDKLPVSVRDSLGFVLNRGLLMLLNETVYMLSENIANSPEDIDNIFIHGMGMKVGPLKLADLIGIDVVYAAISNMYDGFKTEKYRPCPLLKYMLDEGRIGKKAGEGFYKY